MKASVSLITYNHAPYISQAIESVLAQQTNFDFELLIGEDDSNDGTRAIVTDYRSRYPERVRLLLNTRRDVVYVRGRPTGQGNFANNLRNTRGQFVALLDGDDYWTSPQKLQKQVDFLEANPDCALCFHNVRVVEQNSSSESALFHTEPMRPRYGIEDLLNGNFMQTCSVVFRAGLFSDFPPWFFKCRMADWPLHVLNAQHGWIGYLDEVMGVYRRHAGGLWSGQSRLQILADSLQAAKQIRTCLTPAQKKHLDAVTEAWLREMIDLHCAQGQDTAAARIVLFTRLLFRTRAKPWRIFRLLVLRRPGIEAGIPK